MAVFIRHSEEKNSHKFDSALSSTGISLSKIKAKELSKKYGIPKAIYCSPFLRCYETGKAMIEVLGDDVELYIDSDLCKIVKSKHKAELTSHTLKYVKNYDEINWDYDTRVRYVIKNIKDNVWYISHALYLVHVAKNLNISVPKHLSNCYSIIV